MLCLRTCHEQVLSPLAFFHLSGSRKKKIFPPATVLSIIPIMSMKTLNKLQRRFFVSGKPLIDFLLRDNDL